ncbi:acyl-CoA thioesterase [Burkholderiaceae bacterium]|nr:acyl-CoA thioesterase [Burkholderiaceae bacterium]
MNTPDLDACRRVFRAAPFVCETGIEPTAVGFGECETVLAIEPRHLQHSGQVHAGVITTMADHTAGAAAQTTVRDAGVVVTAELKLSLLRAAKGERLVCRAKVIKPGAQVTFTEAEVYCDDKLVAKLSATMAVVRPAITP